MTRDLIFYDERDLVSFDNAVPVRPLPTRSFDLTALNQELLLFLILRGILCSVCNRVLHVLLMIVNRIYVKRCSCISLKSSN